VAFKTWTNPTMPLESSWTERWRRADIGAANGHGNAHSVARLQSAVACGGEVDSVRLLSPQTIDRIFEVQSNGIDLVIGIPLKFGVGYSLLPEGRVCAWGGTGGSTVIIDVDRRITFAYVMNKIAPAAAIAPTLDEQVSEIVKRQATCSTGREGVSLTRPSFHGIGGFDQLALNEASRIFLFDRVPRIEQYHKSHSVT
jgi:Beta-lactamase